MVVLKCKKCNNKGVITIRHRNITLCKEHFLKYYLKTVESTIKKYRMFTKRDKVLVAVSGGKDSMSLLDALKKLDYNISALYINLGIKDYSDQCKKIVEKYCNENNINLIISDIKENYGKYLEEFKKLRRNLCSVCGIIKRYEMNRIAYEKGFNAIATGHNLDDEVSFILWNLMNGNFQYIKQKPVLEKIHEKTVKKVKPLIFLTEKENLLYSLLNNIYSIHLRIDCPYSTNAPTNILKEMLNKLEERIQGIKMRFYKNFLNKSSQFLPKIDHEIKSCKICGYITSSNVCSFCRLFRRG